ncbi:acetylxylan esterase [Arthrobacter agilis]|uniref:acetylxylan esterase n=1 Tax=Arthrobacter agilis TaxID=37921 RepID=UPI000B363A97|nr:acetylxylan esterase [Arthrobacter agilis]OUM41476.1 acetylxylan esterase [Arthrobacter agilis]PPB46194.1 acetylxylan esterase [Arthrobacter agilis]TPV26949.1 acetylxylan esterase [Arthrobacter agilis]VDR32921.1 Cephalosporin C deacetylase [Arthrobacter agilis]
MPHFDLPLPKLQGYRPERDEPADYDAFWDRTLAEQRAHALAPVFEEIDAGYSQLVTEDVTFAGFDGQPVKAWLLRPRHVDGPLPTVVTYIGYGGGRGLPGEWTGLPSAGYAHFVMDLRGQGSGHRTGDTADGALTGPHHGGFMTLGIGTPDTYYYRRLFVDAVHAVEAAQAHPAVDASRTIISGGSQGGGITLAVAALVQRVNDTPPIGAIVDVPFLAHMRHATEIVDTAPYSELVSYLRTRRNDVDAVFRTLSYFDGVNFAARSTMPAMFSVGLLDDVCPPSCVFAAHNHYAGPASMKVYPYNGHEQGGAFQDVEHLRFIRGLVGG